MIIWQRQPSTKSCGQTCIAMLLGIPAADVIAEIPDKNGTVAFQLVKYLAAKGWRMYSWRRSVASYVPVQHALCRVKWGPEPRRRAHWVLWAQDCFWDPLAFEPIFLHRGGRVYSYFEVEPR